MNTRLELLFLHRFLTGFDGNPHFLLAHLAGIPLASTPVLTRSVGDSYSRRSIDLPEQVPVCYCSRLFFRPTEPYCTAIPLVPLSPSRISRFTVSPLHPSHRSPRETAERVDGVHPAPHLRNSVRKVSGGHPCPSVPLISRVGRRGLRWTLRHLQYRFRTGVTVGAVP